MEDAAKRADTRAILLHFLTEEILVSIPAAKLAIISNHFP